MRSIVAVVISTWLSTYLPAQGPIILRDVTRQSGITFRHTDGATGQRYIIETVCAGLALFDYDSDGDVDIYFLNGALCAKSQAKLLRGTRFTATTEACVSRTLRHRPVLGIQDSVWESP